MNLRVITIILLAFILYSGCSREKKADQLSAGQWKVLNYIPADTYYLFYMNPSFAQNNPVFAKYLKNQLKDRNALSLLSDLRRNTGIDFKNGIKELYAANGPADNNAAVIVLKGNQSRLKNYLNDTAVFHKSGSFYETVKQPASYFLYAEDSILAVYSNKNNIGQINSSIKNNKDFMKLISDISYKRYYWFAANQNDFAYTLIKRVFGSSTGKIETVIKNINEVTVSAAFDDLIKLESNWGCKGSDDAMLLSGAVKTALSMNLLSDKNYELNELIKKTEVDRDGNTVSLSLNLNNNDINQIKKLFTNIPGNKL